MARKLNFLRNSLKIFFSRTVGPIFKKFHRNVPWVTLFKSCSRNFDPSKNMALVNGGFLHSADIEKFLKNFLLRNRKSDFEIISQECFLCDVTLFKNCWQKFDPSISMALVNGGFLHYTDMKKCLKNLFLRIRWSDYFNNFP